MRVYSISRTIVREGFLVVFPLVGVIEMSTELNAQDVSVLEAVTAQADRLASAVPTPSTSISLSIETIDGESSASAAVEHNETVRAVAGVDTVATELPIDDIQIVINLRDASRYELQPLLESYLSIGFNKRSRLLVYRHLGTGLELLQGTRRLLAARMLRDQFPTDFARVFPQGKIPCDVIEAPLSEKERVILRADHDPNLASKGLNPYELYLSICELVRVGIVDRIAICKQLGLYSVDSTGKAKYSHESVKKLMYWSYLPPEMLPLLRAYHCGLEGGDTYRIGDGNKGAGGGTPELVRVSRDLQSRGVLLKDVFAHEEFQKALEACRVNSGAKPVTRSDFKAIGARQDVATSLPGVSAILTKLGDGTATSAEISTALNAEIASKQQLLESVKDEAGKAEEAVKRADALADQARQLSDTIERAVTAETELRERIAFLERFVQHVQTKLGKKFPALVADTEFAVVPVVPE